MVTEDSNTQSTTGKIASGYIKATGYKNLVGMVVGYIFGGLMVLIGISLSFLFGKFILFAIFGGIGLLIIFLCKFSSKHSKKMREGKYYQIGKGWVTPK